LNKSVFLVFVFAALGLHSPAHARDKPIKPRIVSAPAVIESSWTGFYIGGHLGGAQARSGSGSVSDPLATIPFATAAYNLGSSSSLLGGAQLGYSFQFPTNWIVGIEVDASWRNLNSSARANLGPFLPNTFAASALGTDLLASIRGRLGYAWDNRWMTYVTGGFALGDINYSANFSCPAPTCLAPFGIVAPGSGRSLDGTWVVGGGAEWKPTGQNWSVGAEYLYYGFNTVHNFPGALLNAATGAQVSFGNCAGAVPCNVAYSVKDSAVQVLRVRMNWMLAP
jgi:outer membrane immunogenic protein